MSCFRTVAEIRAQLIKVQIAIDKSLDILEYELDTGQNKQKVKRNSIEKLQQYQQSLETDLAIACAKQNGTQLTRGVVC